MRLALSILAFMLIPAFAIAAEVAPAVVTDDPFKLIEQIVAAAGTNNWLLLVPLVILGLIAAFRKWIVPMTEKLAWFKTDRGGAVMSLIAAVVTAFVSAVATPGPHSVVAIIMATVTALVSNQLLFSWLNKAVSPTGADKAQELEAKVAVLEARLAGNPVSNATADATNQAITELKGLTGTDIK